MRKASTPPSFPLPASPPFLHLKTNKPFIKENHQMPSLSTIICQMLGTTGGHGTMLMYALPWIPFLCCCPLPSRSGTPRPLQEPPPSPGKPWIDTCLAQSAQIYESVMTSPRDIVFKYDLCFYILICTVYYKCMYTKITTQFFPNGHYTLNFFILSVSRTLIVFTSPIQFHYIIPL